MARKISLFFTIAFLATGILGVAQGGHNHNLIIFGVNAAHNTVHLASGTLALLAFILGEKASKAYLWFVAASYGIVTLAGIFKIEGIVQGLNLNTADNFLHFSFTALALFGIYKSRTPAAMARL